MRISGIYQILNKITNKSYIGSSINCVKRIGYHKSLLKYNKHNNTYLQNSYNKHNLNNFEFKIIEVCDENKLLEREQYYVNLLGNYNITKEVIRNIPSEESKLKHSNTKKEMYKKGLLSKTTKSILQYDLKGVFIKEWNSITEASKSLNIHVTTIIRVLDGTYKQGKGYLWRYSENKIIPNNINFKRKEINVTKSSKKVILTSEDEILEFDSIKLAAAHFNITRQNFIQYVVKDLKFKKKYKIDLIKSGEFSETPEVDNTELSTNLND